jgi:hypothetical protein
MFVSITRNENETCFVRLLETKGALRHGATTQDVLQKCPGIEGLLPNPISLSLGRQA